VIDTMADQGQQLANMIAQSGGLGRTIDTQA
jgi:hypothetical protein